MTLTITQAQLSDLTAIEAIEQAGFTPDEAADTATQAQRLALNPSTFLVAKDDATVVGFINGPATTDRYVTDWMFADTPLNLPEGGYQLVFGLAVAPDHRGQGIGSQLLAALATVARQANRRSITLTCLADRIPFYEKNSYLNRGIADSTHANEIWYNMELPL